MTVDLKYKKVSFHNNCRNTQWVLNGDNIFVKAIRYFSPNDLFPHLYQNKTYKTQ